MNDDIHPDGVILEQHAAGSLSRTEAVRVERHAKRCRHCGRQLQRLHEVPVALEAAGERYRQMTFRGDALALVRAYQAGERRWVHYMRAAFLIPAAACIGFIVLQLLPLDRPRTDHLRLDGSGGMDRLRFTRPRMCSSVSLSCTLPSRPVISASDRPSISFTIPRRPPGRINEPTSPARMSQISESTKGVAT